MAGRSLNLSLTDELRAFIDENSGEGSLYATPSEFLRAILRKEKERKEAAELRDAILEGYNDIIEGRTIAFAGDVRDVIKEAKRRDKKGWK
jgi:antitoxin ParD1/3/4